MSALTWRNWPLPLRAIGSDAQGAVFAAMTFDARRIVTTDSAGAVRVWEVSGQATGAALPGPGEAFAFARATGWYLRRVGGGRFEALHVPDGKLSAFTAPFPPATFALADAAPVAAIVGEDRVELRDLEAGAVKQVAAYPRAPSPIGEPAAIARRVRAALSPDGQSFATATGPLIRIWSGGLGESPFERPSPIGDPVELQFSMDAGALWVLSESGAARWEIQTRQWAWEKTIPGGVRAASWSADRSRLAVLHAGGARPGSILDATSGQHLWEFPRNRTLESVAARVFRGNQLLVCDHQISLYLQDFSSRKRASENWTFDDAHPVASAELSPDGKFAIVATGGPVACLLDLRPGGAMPAQVGEHEASFAYQIADAGDLVFTSLASGRARLWRVNPLQAAGPELRQAERIVCVALSPDGRRACTGSESGEIAVWDPVAGNPTAPAARIPRSIQKMRFAPDGRVVAAVTEGSRLCMFREGERADTNACLALFEEGGGRVHALRFNRGGDLLLVATDAGLAVLDSRRGALLWSVADTVWDADFSADGRQVAYVRSRQKQAFVAEARTGTVRLGPLPHADVAMGVAFHPLQRQLFTTSNEGRVSVWGLEDGTLLRTMTGHADAVRNIRFSRDGMRVSTASLDNTVRLWDSESGVPLGEYMTGHGGSSVSTADFVDGDRRLLVFSNASKGLTLWPVELPPVPAPSWLAELALHLAGRRNSLTGQGPELDPTVGFLKLRERLARMPGEDFYSRWVHWFFADRDTRCAFPE